MLMFLQVAAILRKLQEVVKFVTYFHPLLSTSVLCFHALCFSCRLSDKETRDLSGEKVETTADLQEFSIPQGSAEQDERGGLQEFANAMTAAPTQENSAQR